MYAFLFVLVPLAIVAAWALARDRKRRYLRHARWHACSRGPGLPGIPPKSAPPSGRYPSLKMSRAMSIM